jgi:hypothetical protein
MGANYLPCDGSYARVYFPSCRKRRVADLSVQLAGRFKNTAKAAALPGVRRPFEQPNRRVVQ